MFMEGWYHGMGRLGNGRMSGRPDDEVAEVYILVAGAVEAGNGGHAASGHYPFPIPNRRIVSSRFTRTSMVTYTLAQPASTDRSDR